MRIPLFILLGFLVGACNPRLIPLPPPTPIPPPARAAPMLVTPGPETEKILSVAIADLSSRLSIDPQEVRVLSMESVLWPDAGLGCPPPGQVYAHDVVPGYRIRLAADGQEYLYHTDQISRAILCREDEAPSFPVTPGDIDDGKPWVPVD
ncbi:MAG: hypothetical protein ACM3QS_14885 [Bacteroidota bacterium]